MFQNWKYACEFKTVLSMEKKYDVCIHAVPLTVSCVRARPMPAVLWATHSYAPSSLPEAWGISHDALTEDLQLQKISRFKWRVQSAAFDHKHAFNLHRNSLAHKNGVKNGNN